MTGAQEDPAEVEIENEFAAVVVSIDRAGRQPRLVIRDRRTGVTGHLDATQLEALATATASQMDALVDPGRATRDGAGPT